MSDKKTVPVIIENVSLRVDVSISDDGKEDWDKWLAIVAELKEKFGPDTLLEQLSSLLPGHIEKVTITGSGERRTPSLPLTTQPKQQNANAGTFGTAPPPNPLPLPQGQMSAAAAHILTSRAFKGLMLCQVDSNQLFQALDLDPWSLTPEDQNAVKQYRNEFRERKANVQSVSLKDDDIPF